MEEPPTHVILALRYLGERKKKPVTEEQAARQLDEVGTMPGFGGAQPLPPQLRDMADWVQQQEAKLKGKHGR